MVPVASCSPSGNAVKAFRVRYTGGAVLLQRAHVVEVEKLVAPRGTGLWGIRLQLIKAGGARGPELAPAFHPW
jgi:hypothetical protein